MTLLSFSNAHFHTFLPYNRNGEGCIDAKGMGQTGEHKKCHADNFSSRESHEINEDEAASEACNEADDGIKEGHEVNSLPDLIGVGNVGDSFSV